MDTPKTYILDVLTDHPLMEKEVLISDFRRTYDNVTELIDYFGYSHEPVLWPTMEQDLTDYSKQQSDAYFIMHIEDAEEYRMLIIKDGKKIRDRVINYEHTKPLIL